MTQLPRNSYWPTLCCVIFAIAFPILADDIDKAEEGEPVCVDSPIGFPGLSLELVADIHPNGNSYPMGFYTSENGETFFSAGEPEHGRELWVTQDGVTSLRKDFYPGPTQSKFVGFGRAGASQRAFLLANDDSPGLELWKMGDVLFGFDNPQPILVGDFIHTDPTSISYSHQGEEDFYATLYYSTWPATAPIVLRSDGTIEGTEMVARLGVASIGSNAGYGSFTMATMGELEFCQVSVSQTVSPYLTTNTLYLIEGTSKTKLLSNSNDSISGYAGVPFDSGEVLGDRYHFPADMDGEGFRIWSTDGVPDDFEPGPAFPYTSHTSFFAFANRLWFGGRDEDGVRGLWAYDPALGTIEYIAAVYPNFAPAIIAGDMLYFPGTGGGFGEELFATDGTVEGTVLVADIEAGPSGSRPSRLLEKEGLLYFGAYTCAHGTEPWCMALPLGEPRMIADLYPGPQNGLCEIEVFEPNSLFFAGETPETGCEPWRIVVGVVEEGEGVVEGQPEGVPEGMVEGVVEGQLDGEIEGEGVVEGTPEGEGSIGVEGEGDVEGLTEGLTEGIAEGLVEGSLEGEGILEGQPDEGEGAVEGIAEGTPEGIAEGTPEGIAEGTPEGIAEGTPEGIAEGQPEGTLEGVDEGEGVEEGVGEGETVLPNVAWVLAGWNAADENKDRRLSFAEYRDILLGVRIDFDRYDTNNDGRLSLQELQQQTTGSKPLHNADLNGDGALDLGEILRLIQLYNAGGYDCTANPDDSEDGFLLAADKSLTGGCAAHAADFQGAPDGVISLSELLRMIQLFNFGHIVPCPSEDGFCADS